MLAFTGFLSPWHLLVIAVVALLIWGNRLPEVARSLGRAVNEFKKGLKEVQDEIGRDDDQDDSQRGPRDRLHSPPPDEPEHRPRESEHVSAKDDTSGNEPSDKP